MLDYSTLLILPFDFSRQQVPRLEEDWDSLTGKGFKLCNYGLLWLYVRLLGNIISLKFPICL